MPHHAADGKKKPEPRKITPEQKVQFNTTLTLLRAEMFYQAAALSNLKKKASKDWGKLTPAQREALADEYDLAYRIAQQRTKEYIDTSTTYHSLLAEGALGSAEDSASAASGLALDERSQYVEAALGSAEDSVSAASGRAVIDEHSQYVEAAPCLEKGAAGLSTKQEAVTTEHYQSVGVGGPR